MRLVWVALLLGAFAAGAGAQRLDDLDDGIAAPSFSPFGAVSTPFSDNLPLGLRFPGVGSFNFDVDAPVMLGLELAAALQGDRRGLVSGDWVNVTLPAPLRVLLRSSVRVVAGSTDGGVPQEWATEVEYIADKVTVALELSENVTEALSSGGCLGVSRAVVQVGSAARSVTCSGSSECQGGNTTAPDPRAVAGAIAETLRSSPEVRGIVNKAIDKCRDPLNNTTSSFVQLVDTAIPDVPPEERNGFFGIAVTLLVLLVAGVASAVVCCGCCMGCCCWSAAEETEEETEFLDQCSSIASTPTLPLWSKVVFYALVLVTTGFFLQANLSVGATINLDFTIEGEFVELPSIYDFSILTSTIEMLKAGVYLLGFILLGFSVVWPYLKLIILGTVFALSASQLRPKSRAAIMEWIDALGKWSMFDVFALCACMVIFYVQIESPATYVTPVGWYGFTLSMTPIWGMYANLIAQIMSQCLSIFALWAHHRAYKADWHAFHGTEPTNKDGGHQQSNKEIQMMPIPMDPASSSDDAAAVAAAADDGPTKNDSMAAGLVCEGPPPPMPPGAVMAQQFRGVEMVQRVPLWVQLAVCAMLVSVIALVVCGFFVTGFTVRVVGVLGLIQEAAIPGSSIRYFTPLYVAQEMARVIPPGNVGIAIGTWALIVVFVICVLFVPVAQAAVLLWAWAVPTPLKRLKTLLKANELLSSWQYIEVYLIAVIIGCLQIPVVCALLVGTSCDPIQPGLDWLVQKGIMSHATCFQMQPIVEDGMWCLFSASIILYLCSVIVREAAFELVNTHDPLRAAQGRPLAPGQEAYYARRSRILSALGLVTLVAPVKDPSPAKPTVPVASVAV